MSDQDHPTRNASVETVVLGNEAVLYDERSGTVHHLNPSACAVWMLLDGRPLAEVVAALADRTGAARAEIERDVGRAVAGFGEAGLLAG